MKGVMLTEDYIMRMISQAIAVLVNLVQQKKAGQFQEAHQAIDGALEGLLGLRPDLARHLEDNRLLELLTVQGVLDTARLGVIADLYHADGEILALTGRPAEGAQTDARAFRFYLEIALAQMDQLSPEEMVKIEALAGRLADASLPLETQLARLDYLEALLEKDDQQLAASGLDRQRLQNSAAIMHRQLNQYLV